MSPVLCRAVPFLAPCGAGSRLLRFRVEGLRRLALRVARDFDGGL